VSCQESFYQIQRHYDGELSLEEQTILDRHLLTCDLCRAEFDEYGELFEDMAALVVQVEHRDVLAGTLMRMEEAKSKRRRDLYYRWAAVAASAAVICSTAFLSLTDAGQQLRAKAAALLDFTEAQSAAEQRSAAAAKLPEQEDGTRVENNPEAARYAMAKIRQKVAFPLLEPHHEALQLVSTNLVGGDETALYQMTELTYRVRNGTGKEDTLYLIATPDTAMKKLAKSNLVSYQFKDEVKYGTFIWALVGEHAMTAEINGIFYQLFSPFLTADEIGIYAATLRRHQME